MSKQNKISPLKNQAPKVATTDQKKEVAIEMPYSTKNFYILLGIIAIGTLVAYMPGLWNEFTWDSRKYILENQYIDKFPAWGAWQKIFTTYELGNYHPLTVLTWAIECMFVGKKSTWLYHLDNSFIHIANCYLVYKIMFRLSNKFLLAAITSILFAIHPLHVESVVWAAERKDVLYTLFLLLSFDFYLRYLDNNNSRKWLIYSVLIFIVSCLSKGMAVVLPVVLVITDYCFLNRKAELKLLWEKIPYFAVSLFFGIVSIFAQRDAGADATSAINAVYTPTERILMVIRGVSLYWEKMLFPINLKAFYSYPDKPLPTEFYIAPFVLGLIIFGLYYFGKRNKWVLWCGLYFFIVILPVSQILAIGSAIAADRYFYLSSIGPLFLAAMVFNHFYENRESFRKALPIVGGGLVVLLTAMSFQRSMIWENDIILFSDVLKKYPTNGFITGNVGWAYTQKKDSVQAKAYFLKANELKWETDEIAYQLADIYYKEKDYQNSATQFEKGLKLKPGNKNVYWQLATCYYYLEDQAAAMKNAQLALKEDHKNFFAHNVMGLILTKKGDYAGAEKSFAASLKNAPDFYDAMVNWGHIYNLTKEYTREIPLYEKAMKKQPKQALAYKNLGVVYINLGQKLKAVDVWQKALKYIPTDYSFEYNIGLQLGQAGRPDLGIVWMQKAAQHGDINAIAFLNQRKGVPATQIAPVPSK